MLLAELQKKMGLRLCSMGKFSTDLVSVVNQIGESGVQSY